MEQQRSRNPTRVGNAFLVPQSNCACLLVGGTLGQPHANPLKPKQGLNGPPDWPNCRPLGLTNMCLLCAKLAK
jgi:hypothetical protein